MHRYNAQVGNKKHGSYISRLLGIFDLALRKVNDLLQQHSTQRQFEIREVCIRKLEVNKQKNKVNDMEYSVMKKKKERETTFGLLCSGRLVIKGHITDINIF